MKKLGFIVCGITLGLVGCRTALLRNPGPIAVVCASEMKMKQAVRSGLTKRGWVVNSEMTGRTDASLLIRDHEAKISVMYTASEFSIQYVDSKNLHYGKDSKGREVIHENYNEWINNLVKDIGLFAGTTG